MELLLNPRGQAVAERPRDNGSLVIADLNLEQVREIREVCQFYRNRRPETYTGLTFLLP